MRIIAGQYGGRRIEAPKGTNTRPTTDRVRESLMSALESRLGSFDGLRVLDAFAGSGALGIEALSRGAGHAVFCERDAHTCAVLRGNLSFVPADAYRIVRGDVLKRPPVQLGPFDVVFLDPPYATDPAQVRELLDGLGEVGALSPNAIVTYEHDASADLAPWGAAGSLQWECVATKSWGDTAITTYRKAGQ